MRALVILVATLLAAGALAGCVNTPKDEPVNGANIDDKGVGGNVDTKPPTIKALAPLRFTLSTEAADWVAPGSTVAFDAGTATGSSGAVAYTWAVGARPGTVTEKGPTMDTGSKPAGYIQPSASAPLKFTTPGVWMMHCHPHPWMLSNVTVVEGYQGPSTVEVLIVDGAKNTEFRFVPENIVVGPGTTVVYKNVGAQPHTATEMSQEPPLKKVAATGPKADIALTGEGWQRVVAIAQDAEGRIGKAEHNLYVKDLPMFKSETVAFAFKAGGSPEQADPPVKKQFTLAQPGTIYLNFTAKDAPSGAGVPGTVYAPHVEIHVKKTGETQDSITSDEAASGALTSKATPGTYDLTIVGKQGVNIEGTLTFEVVYEPVPPEPKTGGDDGGHDHGGGGGHHH